MNFGASGTDEARRCSEAKLREATIRANIELAAVTVPAQYEHEGVALALFTHAATLLEFTAIGTLPAGRTLNVAHMCFARLWRDRVPSTIGSDLSFSIQVATPKG